MKENNQMIKKTILVITQVCIFSMLIGQHLDSNRMASIKEEIQTVLDQKYKDAQVMVDKVFSFSELDFRSMKLPNT